MTTTLEIIEAHSIAAFAGSDTACACDRKWRPNAEYRAHVAEVIETYTREQLARAWSEGFHKGRKAPHHITDWPKNPYRAAQTKDKP